MAQWKRLSGGNPLWADWLRRGRAGDEGDVGVAVVWLSAAASQLPGG